jgi:hypothetical protein
MNREERFMWAADRVVSPVSPERTVVILAWIDGEDIEFRSEHTDWTWHYTYQPSWDPAKGYRIAEKKTKTETDKPERTA